MHSYLSAREPAAERWDKVFQPFTIENIFVLMSCQDSFTIFKTFLFHVFRKIKVVRGEEQAATSITTRNECCITLMWQAKIYDMYFRVLFSAFSDSFTANFVRPVIFRRLGLSEYLFSSARRKPALRLILWLHYFKQITTMSSVGFCESSYVDLSLLIKIDFAAKTCHTKWHAGCSEIWFKVKGLK